MRVYDNIIQMVCDGDFKRRDKIGPLTVDDLALIYAAIKEENRDNFH